MNKPPLGLSVALRSPDGTTPFRWGYDEGEPENRPQGLRFRTSRYNGFADGGCTLARPVGRDWPDLALLNDVVFVGADGSTAYEGMIHGRPRSTGEGGDRFQVGLVGWIAQTKRKRFSMVFVDRDLSKWQGPSRQRAVDAESSTRNAQGPEILADAATGSGAVRTAFQDAWTTQLPFAEAWYDAGPGNRIARLRATWTRGSTVNSGDANWAWEVFLASNDVATSASGTGNLRAAGPGSVDHAPVGTWRNALMTHAYLAAPAGTSGTKYAIDWTNVRVIGDHGLTITGLDAAREGVLASDVIRWLVDNHCPGLSNAGILPTASPVPQLAFHDRTWPYDGMLQANAQDLWNLGVWENRTVHYTAPDLSDYDWQVRHGDPGVRINLQGESTEGLLSGLEVQFTNAATGRTDLLLPENHVELRDDSPTNPFNAAGLPSVDTLAISGPMSEDAALQAGASALADRNQPRGIGTIEVSGHIRDRAGNWQPAWKVRADDRIAILNDDNPRPRVIAETDYSDEGRRLQMSIEGSFKRVDAELAARQ